MRQAVLGLALTAVVAAVSWWRGGPPAGLAGGAAGVLATLIEVVALRLLLPTLVPPFERLMKRWAAGLGLRFGGLALVVAAVLWWRERFPVLPTALGFLAVLVPLLLEEMWLVWTKLRTTR